MHLSNRQIRIVVAALNVALEVSNGRKPTLRDMPPGFEREEAQEIALDLIDEIAERRRRRASAEE